MPNNMRLRGWPTSHRVTLRSMRGGVFPRWAVEKCIHDPIVRRALLLGGIWEYRELPRGAVIAIAHIVNCLPTSELVAAAPADIRRLWSGAMGLAARGRPTTRRARTGSRCARPWELAHVRDFRLSRSLDGWVRGRYRRHRRISSAIGEPRRTSRAIEDGQERDLLEQIHPRVGE
jgi:hypothetical protein